MTNRAGSAPAIPQGNLVMREGALSGQMRLHVTGLDAGIYHLVLEGKEREILNREKFVIVRKAGRGFKQCQVEVGVLSLTLI